MTTDAYLWAIFALLFLALVLVVVTARRGPWEPPRITGGHFEPRDIGQPISGTGIPKGARIAQVLSPTTVTLSHGGPVRGRLRFWRLRRRPIKPVVARVPAEQFEQISHVRVDPLWGKNRP